MARRTITTTGHGRASRTPDLAEVRVGIQLTRPSATTARAEAATLMQQVVAAVLGAGVTPADARTAHVTVGPAWEYPADKPPRITGYQASNQLAVTVRDRDAVAQVVDEAVRAGATTVDGLEFRTGPALTAEAATEALAGAIADARARAQALAEEAGLSVGDVRSIEEVPPAGGGPQPMFARLEATAADTPVLPGTSEVEVAVRVVFELAARA
jgi:uncharacterized protein